MEVFSDSILFTNIFYLKTRGPAFVYRFSFEYSSTSRWSDRIKLARERFFIGKYSQVCLLGASKFFSLINSGCWTNNESEFIFRGKIFRDFFSSKQSIFSTFQVIANERNTYVKEHKSRRKKINCIFLIILKNVYYKEMKNPFINW